VDPSQVVAFRGGPPIGGGLSVGSVGQGRPPMGGGKKLAPIGGGAAKSGDTRVAGAIQRVAC